MGAKSLAYMDSARTPDGIDEAAGCSIDLCSDCPAEAYPTDKTRCNDCPRRLGPLRELIA